MTRQRKSTGEFCMTREVFAAADYGRVCQMLGLRPSRPHESADGTNRRRKRRS